MNKRNSIMYIAAFIGVVELIIAFYLMMIGVILGTIIMGISGFFFCYAGFLIIFRDMLNDRKIKKLQINGIKIMAEFDSVVMNEIELSKGQHPYNIYAQWKDPNSSQSYLFKSEKIWFDPTEYIKSKHISVFIDENDPTTYHIDLSFLPQSDR